MGADRQQVDSLLLRTYGKLAVCLYGVHMEKDGRILPVDKGCNLFHRLNGAHLVVYIHDGYQYGVPTDGGFQLLQGYMALAVHRQICDLKPLLLQIRQGVVNRGVFDSGADDVLSGSLVCHGSADKSHIVGFRAAGGEQDFLIPDL